MNLKRITLLILLGSFVLVGSLWATIPERYQTIVDRNSFGLNPPVVDTNAPPPPTPPANVKLTGFTKLGGELRAYFMILPKDAKEQTQYLSLPEGQREGLLEVVKIMEEESEVLIKNSGTEVTLSLKNNGNNSNKPGSPGQPPGSMPPPPPPVPNMGAAPGAVPSVVYNPNNNAKVVAAVPGAPQTAVPGQGGQQPPPVPGQISPETAAGNTGQPASTPMRTIPTRTLRLPPTAQPPNPPR